MKKILYSMVMALALLATSCDNDYAYPPVLMGEVKGSGTAEDPYNVAKAIRVAAANGETSDVFVFTAGYVVSGSIDVSYGNATWNIADAPGSTDQQLIVYRAKDFNNQKFTDANKVKEGDYIVVYAPLINFRGNTPETGTGAYLYSINGVVGSDIPDTPDTPAQPGEPKGTGTADDPYNATKATEVAIANGTTSTENVYVGGYIIKGSISESYMSGTWTIADNADGTGGQFELYATYDFSGNRFSDVNAVKVGDYVVAVGPIYNYNGKTPEMSKGHLYSLNGTVGGNQTPETPETPETPDTPSQPGEAVTSINETFEVGKIPEGWTQVQVAGNKEWYTPSYNSNYYAAMTGYKGTAPFDQWLVTPLIDIDAATSKTLTFDTQVNGYNSTTSVLEVYVMTAAKPSEGSITKLSPALATAPASGYSDWLNSGVLDLASFTGKIYIGFRYYATQDSNYATWCVDNVKVNAQ